MSDDNNTQLSADGRHRYILVERRPQGEAIEYFRAPSDAVAVGRVLWALEGRPAEVWRGDLLVAALG